MQLIDLGCDELAPFRHSILGESHAGRGHQVVQDDAREDTTRDAGPQQELAWNPTDEHPIHTMQSPPQAKKNWALLIHVGG